MTKIVSDLLFVVFLTLRRLPRSTRTDTLVPYTTLFLSTVTAGNSSQMSDGAGAVLLASEQAIKDYGLTPLARFVSFSVAGVRPEVMGIGPIAAIPKTLKQAGLTKDQLAWIELNEAFAAQSLARSEEHTYELQSLMRISYAVF